MFPISETQQRNIHDKINGIQLISGCICAASVGGATLKQEKPHSDLISMETPGAAAAKHKDARKTPQQRLFACLHSPTAQRESEL
jgi:hypothetical protein